MSSEGCAAMGLLRMQVHGREAVSGYRSRSSHTNGFSIRLLRMETDPRGVDGSSRTVLGSKIVADHSDDLSGGSRKVQSRPRRVATDWSDPQRERDEDRQLRPPARRA